MPGLFRIVASLLVAQIYSGIAVNCSGVYAPVVTQDLGVAPHLLGIYTGLLSGMAIFSGFLLSGIVPRFGAVRALQMTLACSSLGFVAAASGQPLLVMASAVLIGTATGLGMPASAQLLAIATPPERLGIVFSIKQAGVPIAIALNGIVIPALLLVTSWEASALVLAAAAWPVIALLQPLRERLDSQRRPDAPLRSGSLLDPVQRVLRRHDLKTLSIAICLLSAVQAVFISYTVSYLNLELGMSLVVAGLALTVSQVITVFTRLACGWWADRLGDPLRVIAWLGIGAGLTALPVALAAPGWPIAAVFASVVLFSVTGGGWMGIYQAALVRYADPDAIPASAVGTQAFLFLGGTTGPLVFAMIAALANTYSIPFAVFGAAGLAAGAWIFARQPQLRAT